jgi:hypothetical protein
MENLPNLGKELKKGRIRAIYYMFICGLHFGMYYYSSITLPLPFYRKVLYLTNMSFYLNMIYYTWMLLTDHGIFHNSKYFNKNTEAAYFKFSYCLSFVVFLMYWGMVFANPDLFGPGRLKIPYFLDLFLHGANYVLNLVEILVVNHKENSRKVGWQTYLAFTIFYGILLQTVYAVTEIAVYPFVKNLTLVNFFVLNSISFTLVMIGDLSYKGIHILKRKYIKLKH